MIVTTRVAVCDAMVRRDLRIVEVKDDGGRVYRAPKVPCGSEINVPTSVTQPYIWLQTWDWSTYSTPFEVLTFCPDHDYTDRDQ